MSPAGLSKKCEIPDASGDGDVSVDGTGQFAARFDSDAVLADSDSGLDPGAIVPLDYWRNKYLIPAIASGGSIGLIGIGDIDQYLHAAQQGPLGSTFDPGRVAHAKGFYCVYDIDPVLVSKTQSVGINCAECDVTTSSLGHEFDYVFASDVIEHVENPVAFLRNIRDSLSSDGIMIITTPNALYWRNILTGCSREFYEHNFTFYPAHFRNLARRLDLDIAELCSFQAVGRLSGLVAKSLHCCVHRFMAQIGRGNSLLFVARRL